MSIQSFSSVRSGEIRGSLSSEQLPDVPCVIVKFKARSSNSGSVYLGVSGTTVPEGNNDTTAGFEIAPGDDTGWIPVSNLNQLYRICATNGDNLTYLALL